ncbi:MAG: hypothetical protein GXP38_12935, partial [Chloroflexi bacterium]|nr:hypothetical protein [Chloroflexota bacterium]
SAREQREIEFAVLIPSELPQAIFSLNWDDPDGYLRLRLQDPSGKAVIADTEHRDDTHHMLVVTKPAAGIWRVGIEILKPCREYHFMLSGKTITTLIAAVGGNPEQRTVGVPVPIYGILSDYRPIAGADVFALVSGPALGPDAQAMAVQSRILRLYDDGNHGDGKAGDGLYANNVTNTTQAGGYTVKLVATGINNRGEEFLRYASVGFNVRPRAVYLWNDDLDTALEYQALLQAHGWVIDLLRLEDVPGHDFRPYALIIIGPETGYRYDFDDPAAAQTLGQWDKPFLGLGEGGAALFAEFDLFIGYGQTWWSSNNNVRAIAPNTVFWNEPLYIAVNRKNPLVQLYPRPLTELGVYLPEAVQKITAVAQEERNTNHYPVIVEQRSSQEFGFWGYNAGPNTMTDDGKKLLINLSHYLRQ